MKTFPTHTRRAGWLLPFLFACATLWAQSVPTTNPLAAPVPDTQAWTNGLAWARVTLADKVKGLLGPDNQVDSLVLHQTLRQLSAAGGGVLYFPAGTYLFDHSVTLFDGVVLRGELAPGVNEAGDGQFAPVTKFEFPRYRPTLSRTRADTLLFTDVPNHTAFKTISIGAGHGKNIGLVQLDLNRAVIDFRSGTGGCRNILLLSLRQNNAVLPDPGIPTDPQRTGGHAWQRWPWGEVASLNVDAAANCLVSNCRLNDRPDDNYRQFGYMTDDGQTFDGARAVFDYTNHPGIRVRAVGATPGGVELTGNYVQVLRGNQPIVSEGAVRLAGNEGKTTEPAFESSIFDGRTATWQQYRTIYEKRDSLTTPQWYASAGSDTLPYRVMLPANYDPAKKYPLVVYLHGMGERGTDNKEQLRNFIWYFTTEKNRRDYPCFVLIPQHSKADQSFLGSERARSNKMMLAVFSVMKKLEKTYSIDGRRRYLIGISSGAWATWEAIVTYPKLFAAAVPIAGYKRFNEFDEKDRKREIANIKDLPIWAFHGSDDEWIPAMYARMTVSTLKNGGGNPRYTEFKGIGHICWNELQYVTDFMPWLFSQRRNQPPVPGTATSMVNKP